MDEGIRVLHIDDEPDVLDLVKAMLQREIDHVTVETATTAAEAMESLDEHVDCVVSDYEMPGQDGLELLEEVRAEYPNRPFILYTGRGSEAVASEAISAGVTDYLEKMGGTEQYTVLANRIENAVSQYRASQRAATLERIRHTVRDVNQALVRDRDPGELQQEVCEILTEEPPYAFAWIGAVEEDTQSIQPRASAGTGDGYLEEISTTLGDVSAAGGPTARAVATNELVVTQSIADDPAFEPWREAALERGFEASAAVPLSFEGEIHGVLNVYTDEIDPFDETERELLRELGGDVGHALHRIEQERRYRQLFEESINAVAVHEICTDEAGKPVDYLFLDVNEAFEAATGLDRAAILNERATDVLPDLDPTLIETYGEVALAGKGVQFDHFSETLGRHYSIAAFPLEDGQFVTTFVDVTERREREQALEEANEELEAVREQLEFALETTNAYTFDWRPTEEAIRRYPTFSAVFGIDSADVKPVFDEFFDIVPPDHRKRVRSTIEDALQEGMDYDLTYPVEPTDEQLWVREQASVVTEDGEPRVVGTVTDVTDLVEYERQLERQNEHLDEFAEVISHDLRNPLNVAFGRAELLAEDCESDHTEPLLDALERMEAIVGNTLTLARQGDTVGETEPVSVPAVVEECTGMIDDEPTDLEVADSLQVRGDRDRIRHVFENLLTNAVEHGPEASDPETDHEDTSEEGVTVRVDRIDDRGFYVADDGSGIPEDEREAVFDPGHTTAEEGTGLGLTIVERIADAHDWDVSVTDSAEGGARFEFTGVELV